MKIRNVILTIRIPRENKKKEPAAELVFENISEMIKTTSFPLSLEIFVEGKYLNFYILSPKDFESLIKGQFYSHYPGVEIEQTPEDYIKTNFQIDESWAGTELRLSSSETLPIKNYKNLDEDFLTHLSGVFASFAEKDRALLQIVIQPVDKDKLSFKLESFYKRIWAQKWKPAQLKQKLEEIAKEKLDQACFRCTVRILCLSSSKKKAQLQIQAIGATFKNLKNANLNSLEVKKLRFDQLFLQNCLSRTLAKQSFLLNSGELATIFHLPYEESQIAQITETKSKKVEPPSGLPKEGSIPFSEICLFGETDFRNEHIKFGFNREDRSKHVYVIGKTGMGKSKLLELLILSDIYAGKGVCLIDPHGDLAEDVLRYIPKKRIQDVIYFNPADKEYPLGFNPMENVESFEDKQIIVAGFIAIFKKLFFWNWNQRLEHMLRYTTLALLDYPNSNVLGITKMLSDNIFRQKIVDQIQDSLVKNFWATEFASWNDQFAQEAIVPIINKIGQFIASPTIRNIVGQTKSTINIEKVIKKEKIVIANFSIGRLGEENSTLLGSMFITKLWQSAMAQATVPENKRTDYYLYVDEFQNFATSAFANILSEARKYKLNLTVAHQYMKQLPEQVRATIFGNVGSIITFRVGAQDAEILEKELKPQVTADDMTNLDMRNVYIKMSIDGQTAKPFSARTITLKKPDKDYFQEIIRRSRNQWARKKSEVETQIEDWEKKDFSLEKKEKERKDSKFPKPIV